MTCYMLECDKFKTSASSDFSVKSNAEDCDSTFYSHIMALGGVVSSGMEETGSRELPSSEVFLGIGMLILEGRVAGLTKRGYGEGPHISILNPLSRHTCDSDNFLCLRKEKFEAYMLLLWENTVSMCIEVLLAPDCQHGRQRAQNIEPSIQPDQSYIVLEQWTVQMVTRSSEAVMTDKSLLLALRSYLHFSQLSAWYSKYKGAKPANVLFRITGLQFASNFPDWATPDYHQFPLATVGKKDSVKVSVRALPRQENVPYVICAQQEEGAEASCDGPLDLFQCKGLDNGGCRYRKPGCRQTGKHLCSGFAEQVDEYPPQKLADPECGRRVKKKLSEQDDYSMSTSEMQSVLRSLRERQPCNSGKNSPRERSPVTTVKASNCDSHLFINSLIQRGLFTGSKNLDGPLDGPSKSCYSRDQTTNGCHENGLKKFSDFSSQESAFHNFGLSKKFKEVSCKEAHQKCQDLFNKNSPFNSFHFSPQIKEQESCQSNKAFSSQESPFHECSRKERYCQNDFKEKTHPHADFLLRRSPPLKHKHLKSQESNESSLLNGFLSKHKKVQETEKISQETSTCRCPSPKLEKRQKSMRDNLLSNRARQFVKPLDSASVSFKSVDVYDKKSDERTSKPSITEPPINCVKEEIGVEEGYLKRNIIEKVEEKSTSEKDELHSEKEDINKNHEGGRPLPPSPTAAAEFRRYLDSAASMVFHQRTGLPLTSSPAPVRKGTAFTYDSSLNSPLAIKSALLEAQSGEESFYTSSCLLGNFEESVLNGRLEPVSTVPGFTAEIGASGRFQPAHITCPVTVFFYTLCESQQLSSPYLAHINIGKKPYRVPNRGTIQVTLFNPHRTVVKMWVVSYDLSDMPPMCQTFIRQRTLYMPVGSSDRHPDAHQWLRYLIHLRFHTSKSNKLYLHTDIRMIIFRKSDVDAATLHRDSVPYELRSFTHRPTNPNYSPRR